MAKTKYSPRFATVQSFYQRGTWNKARVDKAVECGWITEAERAEIVGEEVA